METGFRSTPCFPARGVEGVVGGRLSRASSTVSSVSTGTGVASSLDGGEDLNTSGESGPGGVGTEVAGTEVAAGTVEAPPPPEERSTAECTSTPTTTYSSELCHFLDSCVHPDPAKRWSALDLQTHPFLQRAFEVGDDEVREFLGNLASGRKGGGGLGTT